jgi:hypothetical protein
VVVNFFDFSKIATKLGGPSVSPLEDQMRQEQSDTRRSLKINEELRRGAMQQLRMTRSRDVYFMRASWLTVVSSNDTVDKSAPVKSALLSSERKNRDPLSFAPLKLTPVAMHCK